MRRFLCKLGIHLSTHLDCATRHIWAERCNDCGTWIDPVRGADVDAFRATQNKEADRG